MNWVYLLTIVLSYGLVLAVGLWASKVKESNTEIQNIFLAGRSLPLLLGAFTMTATWVGGGYINGTAEAVYLYGLRWAQGPWGYALSLLVGGLLFAIPMHKGGYNTFLDPFEKKYGEKITGLLFIPAFIGDLFWSSAILAALGATFSTLFNFDYHWSIIISSSIAILYTFLGGLWSVAYTDFVQLIFIFLGLGVCLPFALSQVGDWTSLYNLYEQKFGAGGSLFPPLSSFLNLQNFYQDEMGEWIDGALLLVFGGIPWGVYFQRVLACPTGKQARSLSLWACLGCLLLAIPPILIGMIATTVDWTQHGLSRPPEAALVLPYVLRYLTPTWVAACGLSAVAAAVMSSIDSSILSVAGMFTLNVYRPLMNSKAKENELKKVMKGSILVVGAMATWLALRVNSIYGLWYLCSDLVYVLLFPQLVLVLFSKNINSQGVLWGLIVGFTLRLGMGEELLGISAYLPEFINRVVGMDIHLSRWPYRTICMSISFVVTILVSYFSEHLRYLGVKQEHA